MAIITNKLRHLMAQAFFEELADTSSTKNVYFFVGRSKPWSDEDAKLGQGTLTLLASSTSLSINNGSFSGIPLGSTIKNLDTNEIRQLITTSGNPPQQAVVNAPPTIPWSTQNWAWKSPSQGRIWVDDANPPVPNGSLHNQNECFTSMLALKKINQTNLNDNASYVIVRHDWDESLSTVYAPYRDNDGDLLVHPTQEDIDAANAWNSQYPQDSYTAGSSFVVVHYGSNYHVFKCLENNGAHNKSIVMPDKSQCTQDNNYIHTASDGYKWKFMYSLSADQVLKFLTDSWLPVRVAIDPNDDPSEQNAEQWRIQQSAVPGSIEIIHVVDASSPVVFYGDCSIGTQLPDQTGILSTELKLPADASAIDDYYKGCEVFIFSDTSGIDAQKRTIAGYNATNKIITLSDAWAQQPTILDSVCIAPKIQIDGMIDTGGSEASARAVVNVSGYITGIKMLSIGRNYRVARAICTVNGFEVAAIEAAISPITGHGSDAVQELGGYFVMLYTQLKNIEGDINSDETYDLMLSNDYRVIGIVRNVKAFNGIDYASDNTLKAVKTLQISSTTPSDGQFITDEVLEYRDAQQNLLAKGYVIEHIKDPLDPLLGTITFVQDLDSGFDSFAAVNGATLTGLNSAVTAIIVQLETPEVDDYTGDILYIEQRKPIIRATEQLEDIKLVVEF